MAVAQPAANTWDVPAIVFAACAVLRLENADPDEAVVASAAREATQLIDVELDKHPVDEADPAFDAGGVPTLVRAAAKLTVQLYLNPPGADGGPADPIESVRGEVSPWRERWGLA